MATGRKIEMPFLAVLGLTVSVAPVLGVAPSGVVLVVPLIFAWSSQAGRALHLACAAGVLVTLYGAAGTVSYLGVTTINSNTVAYAVAFAGFLSTGIFLGLGVFAPVPVGSGHVGRTTRLLIGAVACLALLVRFRNGVPLLQGDEGRLASVASENPYIGLASGVLPITFAFLRGADWATWAFRIAILVLVLGTGSRLLLAAVVIGVVSSTGANLNQLPARSRVFLVVAVIAGVTAVLQVYSYRTSEEIVGAYSARAAVLTGPAGVVTDAIGPSLFYGSRNGLTVYQLMEARNLHPPGGFITGGIGAVFRFNDDPERWLSGALGLDVTETGAIATPVWSGARRDLGLVPSLVFALMLGAAIARWARPSVALRAWAAFAVALSFYGSYLVSTQFVLASFTLTIVLARFPAILFKFEGMGRTRQSSRNP